MTQILIVMLLLEAFYIFHLLIRNKKIDSINEKVQNILKIGAGSKVVIYQYPTSYEKRDEFKIDITATVIESTEKRVKITATEVTGDSHIFDPKIKSAAFLMFTNFWIDKKHVELVVSESQVQMLRNIKIEDILK